MIRDSDLVRHCTRFSEGETLRDKGENTLLSRPNPLEIPAKVEIVTYHEYKGKRGRSKENPGTDADEGLLHRLNLGWGRDETGELDPPLSQHPFQLDTKIESSESHSPCLCWEVYNGQVHPHLSITEGYFHVLSTYKQIT